MNTFDAWNEMEKERKQRKENAPCSEWISVKERLPEERQFVLLCPKHEGIVALGYRHRVRDIDFWEYLNPTLREYEVPWVGAGIVEFWMPLPKPPKEGEGCLRMRLI